MVHIYQRALPRDCSSITAKAPIQSTKIRTEYFMQKCQNLQGYKKEYIPKSEVYKLTRYYRTSKFNPEFSQTIATVKAVTDEELKPFYLVLYKWASGESKEFFLRRHGNAKKPTSSSYFRKDPHTFTAIDNLLDEGMPTDKVYNTLIQDPAYG